jgi:hypothetical protein
MGTGVERGQAAGRLLQIEVVSATIRSPSEIEDALARLDRSVQAVLVAPQPTFHVNRQKIIDLTLKARLPATYEWRTFVEDGGPMSLWSGLRGAAPQGCPTRRQSVERRKAGFPTSRATDRL